MIEVLEDVVSADGKNTKKIKKRIGKGIGIISEITNILEKTTLGENYFTTGLVWPNKARYRRPRSAFIEKIFKYQNICTHRKFVLGTRMFEHQYYNYGAPKSTSSTTWLQGKKEEILSQIFQAQWKHSSPGDWCEQVKLDLLQFGMDKSLE